jgi:hypothetical protein
MSHILCCCRDLLLLGRRVVYREAAQSPNNQTIAEQLSALSSAQKPRGKQEKTERTKIRERKGAKNRQSNHKFMSEVDLGPMPVAAKLGQSGSF